MSLGDDSDFANEISNNFNDDDGTDDCQHCSGSGYEYEGDLIIGDCTHCDGNGIL